MLVYPHFSSNGCCALACIHFILTYTTKPTMYCYPCLACEILYLSISILRLDGNVEQPFTSRLHLCPTNAPLCGYCKFSQEVYQDVFQTHICMSKLSFAQGPIIYQCFGVDICLIKVSQINDSEKKKIWPKNLLSFWKTAETVL